MPGWRGMIASLAAHDRASEFIDRRVPGDQDSGVLPVIKVTGLEGMARHGNGRYSPLSRLTRR